MKQLISLILNASVLMDLLESMEYAYLLSLQLHVELTKYFHLESVSALMATKASMELVLLYAMQTPCITQQPKAVNASLDIT